MKKIILFLLLLGTFFVCAACQAEDPDNLFEMTERIDTISVETSIMDSSDSYYQYGNMQKNIPAGNFMRYGDDVLFIEILDGESMVYTYNLLSGEVSTLCKNATCAHSADDGECGLATVFGNLEQNNGTLYAMNSSFQIIEWQGGQTELVHSGAINGFWHSGENLYIKTSDASLMVYKDGCLEPQMMIEEYSSWYDVIFDDYLYSHQSGSVVRIDLRTEELQQAVLLEKVNATIDGEHIYYSPQENNYLYRCDMNGDNAQLLLEQKVLPASWNFDDDYFYFRLYTNDEMRGEDSHTIYRLSKDNPTNIEVLAKLPEPAYQIFTVPGSDKLFVKTVIVTLEDGSNQSSIYVVTTDGSSVELLDLPN